MTGRLANIQALRACAALAVLAAHVRGAEADYGGANTLLPRFLDMGVAGVDLFFVISGFVMAHTAAADRGPRAAARFLYNRATRIYPAYWAATLILAALYMGKQALFAEPTPWPDKIATVLLSPSDHYPLLPVGWTLVHEMYFYIVFAVFVLARIPMMGFLAAWVAIIAAAHATGAADAGSAARVAFSPLTFEFIAGALIARFVKQGAAFAAPALYGGIAAFAALCFFAHALYPDSFADPAARAALYGPVAALIVYGAAGMEAKGAPAPPRWLIATGDASYAIYLIHVPVFLVVGKLVSLVLADGAFDNIALIVLYTACALGAGFALHRFIEKPLLSRARAFGDRRLPRRAGAVSAAA